MQSLRPLNFAFPLLSHGVQSVLSSGYHTLIQTSSQPCLRSVANIRTQNSVTYCADRGVILVRSRRLQTSDPLAHTLFNRQTETAVSIQMLGRLVSPDCHSDVLSARAASLDGSETDSVHEEETHPPVTHSFVASWPIIMYKEQTASLIAFIFCDASLDNSETDSVHEEETHPPVTHSFATSWPIIMYEEQTACLISLIF